MATPFSILSVTILALAGYVGEVPARADDVNRTGQGQQTSGSGPSNPGNPAQDSKPSYPGDQPAKQGTDPSSQVHNVDPRDLVGKKHRD